MNTLPLSSSSRRLTRLTGVPGRDIVRAIFSRRSGRIGLALVGFVILVAVVGPAVAPHSPSAVVGAPFESPSATALLGTDVLGRDVLSRVLSGGRSLLLVALIATGLAYAVGVPLGLVSGFRRGVFDRATVIVVDVLLAIPPLLLVLVLLAGAGSKLSIVTLGISLVLLPGIVRIVRTVTRDVAESEFVEVAVARGESLAVIVGREILPNVWAPIMADFGVRIAWAVTLYAALSFLGFGQSPPAADWGLMINENRGGLLLQPWALVVPAIVIAVLTVGANLAADAYAQATGRTGGRGV